jgi:hypothetical protein
MLDMRALSRISRVASTPSITRLKSKKRLRL